MNSVMVTGATGNIGSKVVQELRERGVPVRALVRDSARAGGILGRGVDLVEGDFADPASLRRAFAGVGRLFLACGNDPRQVEFETNAIDAAVAAGVRGIVKLSAMGAEIGSPVAYWDWHARIERHLGASRLPALVLRPAFAMTNLLASAEAVKQTGKLFAPAGEARIAMIDPRDVAAAAAAALTEDVGRERIFHLTGPRAITFAQVADDLSTAIGRPVAFVDLPDEAARAGMVQAGLPEPVAAQLVTLFGELRRGAYAQPADGVRALTGRDPHPFAAFAADHAALFGG